MISTQNAKNLFTFKKMQEHRNISLGDGNAYGYYTDQFWN